MHVSGNKSQQSTTGPTTMTSRQAHDATQEVSHQPQKTSCQGAHSSSSGFPVMTLLGLPSSTACLPRRAARQLTAESLENKYCRAPLTVNRFRRKIAAAARCSQHGNQVYGGLCICLHNVFIINAKLNSSIVHRASLSDIVNEYSE